MMYFKERIRAWRSARHQRQVTLEQARLRAGRGAVYLDDVLPGWYRRIDPETLALRDGGCCVLGQLHGAYRAGLHRAQLFNASSAPRANLSPVHFGFHCVQVPNAALRARDYDHLDVAWRAEIARRQQQDGSSQPARQSAGRRSELVLVS